MKHTYSNDELKDAAKKSLSIAGICRELGIIPAGGNYRTLNNKIKKLDINISHFTGKAWNQGDRFRQFGKKRNLFEILIKDSPHVSTSSLKKRLINEGIKKNKCEECGVDEWNGKKIVCELDHVNGDSTDNRIENLKILCPNCHSQTPTFRRKNKTASSKKYNNGTGIIKKPLPLCKCCGDECETRTRKYCSKKCQNDDNDLNIPKVPELLEMFDKYKSFVGVSKQYGVSDNAVRKWCKKYGILEMIKEIKQ